MYQHTFRRFTTEKNWTYHQFLMDGNYMASSNYLYNSFKWTIWTKNSLTLKAPQLCQFIPNSLSPQIILLSSHTKSRSICRHHSFGTRAVISLWVYEEASSWSCDSWSDSYRNVHFFTSVVPLIALLMVATSVQGARSSRHHPLSPLAATPWTRPRSWSSRNRSFC